ncbi:AaceriAGR170Cp [[Ashbya] aceris (nom. inval.)]|nr:AaceriAGR170Cp [[Ashbya] aceris (nom. inval.)]
MTIFLGVYKAVYAYEPQNEEELALEEDELLYLLQKSEVDDWWTVKKRVLGGELDEPVGLVPNNYIEEAPVLGRVRAVYDYEEVQNPDEELVFREGDEFDVYDDRDADWVLVRKRADGSVGFVPGNYVEKVEAAGSGARAPPAQAAPAPAPAPAAAALPVLTTAAAVQERPAQERQQPRRMVSGSSERDDRPLPRLPVRTDYSEDEEAPPPKPARPEPNSMGSGGSQSAWIRDEAADSVAGSASGSWDVQEVDGRRKKKAKLKIAGDTVVFCPAEGDIKSWPITHLISYDNEKKHIFLEFKDPYCNLELHVGTNNTAIEIKALLAEMKAAVNPGALREIEAASAAPKKRGVIKYNFFGESSDELTVKEGDVVNILNDKKSADWWMCELVGTNKQGVIPAQFIDVQPTEARKSLTAMITGMRDGSSASSQKGSHIGDWKQDADQDSSERRKSVSKKKDDKKSKKKKFPDPKNTRIWVDRSNTFKVEAEFLGFVDGKVHLHKVNGVKIAVAVEKLSLDDLAYVEKATGTSLSKYKPEVKAPSSSRSDEQEKRKQLRQHEDREREREERERDRRLRERELEELRKARDLLDEERAKLRSMQENSAQRPKSAGSEQDYDWFEFFLNCGVDVSNCQRYTLKFEKEHISKEILPDLCPPILRTLDMREGDIIRVMKYLDQQYGRVSQSSGSPPADANNAKVQGEHGLSEQLLPIQANTKDDDAWTVKPAANTESSLPHSKKEFSGSFQDLLDLKPLEPKKKEETPQPNLKDLESVKTGSSAKSAAIVPQTTAAPLDPFKTGGNNLLPTATGGVLLMPVLTGGLMPLQTTGGLIPLQRTGGFVMPQTTFGQATGTVLPVQKTANGLIPIGGGLMPQTTFGVAPLNTNITGGNIAFQRTGGMVTGMMPQTSFGGPMNPVMTGGMVPLQRTGGAMPNMMPQTSFGTIPMNQASTGMMMQSQITGGMPMAGPQTSFAMPAMNQTYTGGVPGVMPQTSFGMAQMNPGSSSGMVPLQRTGGMPGVLPQTSFANAPINQALTGGMPMGTLPTQTTFGAQQQMTGFQQNPVMGMQNTSGMTTFPNTTFGTANINQLSNNMQGMNLNQQQVPLQNQPTGFGFGNGPQQQKQANIYNASAANPFGF